MNRIPQNKTYLAGGIRGQKNDLSLLQIRKVSKYLMRESRFGVSESCILEANKKINFSPNDLLYVAEAANKRRTGQHRYSFASATLGNDSSISVISQVSGKPTLLYSVLPRPATHLLSIMPQKFIVTKGK